MKSKRKTYLIKPKMQLKIALWMVLISTLIMSSLAWLLFSSLNENPQISMMGAEWVDAYNAKLRVALASLAGLVLTSSIAMFLFGIYVTQKVAGPLVPIERMLGDLLEGNYDTQDIQLRKGDELQELAASLNELKNKLKNSGSSAR